MDDTTERARRWANPRHVRNAALRHQDTRAAFFAFVRDCFDALLKQLGDAGGATGAIGSTCDVAELDRMKAFFEPKLKTLQGAQRAFDEGVAEAERCIRLRKKGAPVFR